MSPESFWFSQHIATLALNIPSLKAPEEVKEI
jgi:hypothetical protein